MTSEVLIAVLRNPSSIRWLEYSLKEDRAFCFACGNFSTFTAKSDIAFTKTGWDALANDMETNQGLRKHDACNDTMGVLCYQREYEASEIWWIQTGLQLLAIILNTWRCCSNITSIFVPKKMAYRGHDETSESLNTRKWNELINLMLRTNSLFKTLHGKMKQHIYRNNNYTSKRICNELVKTMAFEVRRNVKEWIEHAGRHSLLIDECKANAGHGELAICFRFVNALVRLKSTSMN